MAVVRPSPTWEAPAGHVHEPMLAGDDWRVVTRDKRCRHQAAGAPGCKTPAMVEINRSRQGGENWWAYCQDHAYGRWVEDGKVWEWRVVPVPAPDALPDDDAFTAALNDLVSRVNGFVYAGDRLNAVVDTLRHLRADPALAATLLGKES